MHQQLSGGWTMYVERYLASSRVQWAQRRSRCDHWGMPISYQCVSTSTRRKLQGSGFEVCRTTTGVLCRVEIGRWTKLYLDSLRDASWSVHSEKQVILGSPTHPSVTTETKQITRHSTTSETQYKPWFWFLTEAETWSEKFQTYSPHWQNEKHFKVWFLEF